MASIKKQIQYVEENTDFRIERWEKVWLNGYKAVSIEYSRPHSQNARFVNQCVIFDDEIKDWFMNRE